MHVVTTGPLQHHCEYVCQGWVLLIFDALLSGLCTPQDFQRLGNLEAFAYEPRCRLCPATGLFFKNQIIFFLSRTAPREHPPPTVANHHQPSTTNHQPPTANHQPPTATNRQPPTFEVENVPCADAATVSVFLCPCFWPPAARRGAGCGLLLLGGACLTFVGGGGAERRPMGCPSSGPKGYGYRHSAAGASTRRSMARGKGLLVLCLAGSHLTTCFRECRPGLHASHCPTCRRRVPGVWEVRGRVTVGSPRACP